jgi:hypothetical protein
MAETAAVERLDTDEIALLERHRPVLRYDRQYDYRAASVLGAVENPGNILRRFDGEVLARAGGEPSLSLELLVAYPAGLEARHDDCLAMGPDVLGDARRMEGEERYAGRLYGRVVEDGGRTWLQYWFWLYYNPKNLFGFGRHEGDWELVQIGLGDDDEPELAAYSQHSSGETRRFSAGEVQIEERAGGVHPVVYVASLSHAAYFEPGTHPYPSGIDHAYGDGPVDFLPVEPPGSWAEWEGRWGSSERTIAGRLGNGPPSPARQAKWSSPAGFQAKLRRRRLRALIGRAVHVLGRVSYPLAPAIEARLEAERCMVDYRFNQARWRHSRHLYLTVHDGERVIASRALHSPAAEGTAVLVLPQGAKPDTVWASTFNRLRQRSELARGTEEGANGEVD